MSGLLFRRIFGGRFSFPIPAYTRFEICQEPRPGGSQSVTARRLRSARRTPDDGLLAGVVGVWMVSGATRSSTAGQRFSRRYKARAVAFSAARSAFSASSRPVHTWPADFFKRSAGPTFRTRPERQRGLLYSVVISRARALPRNTKSAPAISSVSSLQRACILISRAAGAAPESDATRAITEYVLSGLGFGHSRPN
jgi:hypothetical protein